MDGFTLAVSDNDTDKWEEYAIRTLISQPHLLKDDPGWKEMEQIGMNDKEYSELVHVLRTGISNRTLSSDSEERNMGGEVG